MGDIFKRLKIYISFWLSCNLPGNYPENPENGNNYRFLIFPGNIQLLFFFRGNVTVYSYRTYRNQVRKFLVDCQRSLRTMATLGSYAPGLIPAFIYFRNLLRTSEDLYFLRYIPKEGFQNLDESSKNMQILDLD